MFSRLEHDPILFFQYSFLLGQSSKLSFATNNDKMDISSKAPEINEISGSTIYLTFNRPKVDDCVCRSCLLLCKSPMRPR